MSRAETKERNTLTYPYTPSIQSLLLAELTQKPEPVYSVTQNRAHMTGQRPDYDGVPVPQEVSLSPVLYLMLPLPHPGTLTLVCR